MKPHKAKVQRNAARRAHVAMASRYQRACYAVDRLIADGDAIVASLDDARRLGNSREREIRAWDAAVAEAKRATSERW